MESLFTVGQKVVCVDSKSRTPLGPNGKKMHQAPLIEGKVYTIKDICFCTKCGSVSVDVGFTEFGRCWCKCGNHIVSSVWWLNQNRFVPLDFDKAADEEIRESLNQSLVEK